MVSKGGTCMTSEFYSTLGILCLIIAGFLILRGYYRFLEWQREINDDFWRLLSFFAGGAGSLLLGICLIGMAASTTPAMFSAFVTVGFVGLILATAAVGLMTYFYYLKWSEI